MLSVKVELLKNAQETCLKCVGAMFFRSCLLCNWIIHEAEFKRLGCSLKYLQFKFSHCASEALCGKLYYRFANEIKMISNVTLKLITCNYLESQLIPIYVLKYSSVDVRVICKRFICAEHNCPRSLLQYLLTDIYIQFIVKEEYNIYYCCARSSYRLRLFTYIVIVCTALFCKHCNCLDCLQQFVIFAVWCDTGFGKGIVSYKYKLIELRRIPPQSRLRKCLGSMYFL